MEFQENYNYINDEKRSKRLGVVNIILTIIILLLIALLILFSTTVTSIRVVGESMLPNVEEGDRLVLLKWGYKLDYGDIIVFHREQDEHPAVKRIIGKGGDVIGFDRSIMQWTRNGEPVDESEYFDGIYSENYFSSSTAPFFGEGLVIPDGSLFVLGDNRNMSGVSVSKDSHLYGPLAEKTVMGKVIRII